MTDPLTIADEMLDGLEGVTPGPWRPSSHGFQVVSDAKGVCDVSVAEIRTKGYSEAEQVALARHIAKCSPDRIRILAEAVKTDRARAEKAEAEVERLRKAISWIQHPFVDEHTPFDELKKRVTLCVSDAAQREPGAHP